MSGPAEPLSMPLRKVLRICLVTPDINGPVRNGGIGIACEAIGRVAVEAGHRDQRRFRMKGIIDMHVRHDLIAVFQGIVGRSVRGYLGQAQVRF